MESGLSTTTLLLILVIQFFVFIIGVGVGSLATFLQTRAQTESEIARRAFEYTVEDFGKVEMMLGDIKKALDEPPDWAMVQPTIGPDGKPTLDISPVLNDDATAARLENKARRGFATHGMDGVD